MLRQSQINISHVTKERETNCDGLSNHFITWYSTSKNTCLASTVYSKYIIIFPSTMTTVATHHFFSLCTFEKKNSNKPIPVLKIDKIIIKNVRMAFLPKYTEDLFLKHN